jgi:hypothetical protein
VLQPDLSVKFIVPLLAQEELVMTSECRIRLAVLIQIRCVRPRAIATIEAQDHAFADVDKESDCSAASEWSCQCGVLLAIETEIKIKMINNNK